MATEPAAATVGPPPQGSEETGRADEAPASGSGSRWEESGAYPSRRLLRRTDCTTYGSTGGKVQPTGEMSALALACAQPPMPEVGRFRSTCSIHPLPSPAECVD